MFYVLFKGVYHELIPNHSPVFWKWHSVLVLACSATHSFNKDFWASWISIWNFMDSNSFLWQASMVCISFFSSSVVYLYLLYTSESYVMEINIPLIISVFNLPNILSICFFFTSLLPFQVFQLCVFWFLFPSMFPGFAWGTLRDLGVIFPLFSHFLFFCFYFLCWSLQMLMECNFLLILISL